MAMEIVDGPVYCEFCEMYLNGSEQYTNHILGKKHKTACTKSLRNKSVEASQQGLPQRLLIARRGQQVLTHDVLAVSGRHLTTLQYDEFSTWNDLNHLLRPYALTVFHGLSHEPHSDLLLRVLFGRLQATVRKRRGRTQSPLIKGRLQAVFIRGVLQAPLVRGA